MHETTDLITYKFLLIVAIALSFHLSASSLSRRRRYVSILFLALNCATGLWCAGKLLMLSTADVARQILYLRLMLIGSTAAPPAFLCLVLNVERDRPAWSDLALWIVPAFAALAVVTNDLHRLVWTGVGPLAGPVILPTRGPLYWIIVSYAYALILAGLVATFVKALEIDNPLHRWYGMVFVSAMAPVSVSVSFLFFARSSPIGDPTPLSFAAANIGLAYANRFFNPIERIPFAKEALFDALREPILIVSRKDRVVTANRAAIELFGPGVVGGPRPAALAALSDASGGGPVEIGGRLFGVSLFPFKQRGGYKSQTFLVVMLADVDELERARRELAEQRRRADAANKAKGDFLAAMSHELRTPLNAIIGLTDLSLRQARLDDRTREDLGIALESAHRLLALLNEILDLSKIEAGRVVLERANFDPVAHVERVLSSFRPLAASKGLELGLAASPDAPRAVLGDPLRFDQIVSNLVSNAVKFTERGFVRATVGRAPGGPRGGPPIEGAVGVAVAVEDSGIGIGPERLEAIFEDFAQAEAGTARRYGGTGLGLGIARRLARLLGGEVRVESRYGSGSTFSFDAWFEPGDASRIAADRPGPIAAARRALAALVVEDDDVNARVALRFLETAGHRAARVASGRAAIDALLAGSFDVVLMDIEMPGMDGFEAAARIRSGEAGEAARELPVIAMTAHAGQGVRDRVAAAGMDGYVPKPVSFAELEAALAAVAPAGAAPPPGPGSSAMRETDIPAEAGGLRAGAGGKPAADLRVALARLGGDRALLAEIAVIFRDEAPAHLAAVREAAAAGDAAALRVAAHAIRSGAKALGATALDEAALAVELAAGSGDLASAIARVGPLEREFARLLEELERPPEPPAGSPPGRTTLRPAPRRP